MILTNRRYIYPAPRVCVSNFGNLNENASARIHVRDPVVRLTVSVTVQNIVSRYACNGIILSYSRHCYIFIISPSLQLRIRWPGLSNAVGQRFKNLYTPLPMHSLKSFMRLCLVEESTGQIAATEVPLVSRSCRIQSIIVARIRTPKRKLSHIPFDHHPEIK